MKAPRLSSHVMMVTIYLQWNRSLHSAKKPPPNHSELMHDDISKNENLKLVKKLWMKEECKERMDEKLEVEKDLFNYVCF